MKTSKPWIIATLLCVVVVIGISPVLFADYANKIILLGPGGGGTTVIDGGGATNGIAKLNGTGTNTTIVTLLTVNGNQSVTGDVTISGGQTNNSDMVLQTAADPNFYIVDVGNSQTSVWTRSSFGPVDTHNFNFLQGGQNVFRIDTSGNLVPLGVRTLGTASLPWAAAYASNVTISTAFTNSGASYFGGHVNALGSNRDILGFDDILGDYVQAQIGLSSLDWLNVLPATGSTESPMVVFNTNIAATAFFLMDTNGHIRASGSYRLIGGASPSTTAAGQFDFDNNAWAASRGAFQLYDGTANTYLIGVLASDTPSDGQIPQWNTGGTITWEDAGAGSGDVTKVGTPVANQVTYWTGDGTVAGSTNLLFNPSGTGYLQIGAAGFSGQLNMGGIAQVIQLNNGSNVVVNHIDTLNMSSETLSGDINNVRNLTLRGNFVGGDSSTDTNTLNGTVNIPNLLALGDEATVTQGWVTATNDGTVINFLQGRRQQTTNLTEAISFTVSGLNSNWTSSAELQIEGGGFPVTFMGQTYWTYTDIPTYFYFSLENGATNCLSTGITFEEQSYASTVVFDVGNSPSPQLLITNRASAGNLFLIISNDLPGVEWSAVVIGEDNGGTDRIVTVTNQSGILIQDMDSFGTALASGHSQTLTNGNTLELSGRILRLNGTNINSIVSKQAAY